MRRAADGDAGLFKIGVQGSSVAQARTELTAHSHTVATDEPTERGANDHSAMALDYARPVSWVPNVITDYAASPMGITIRHMDMRIAGHFDTRGIFGKAEAQVPFPTIELEVLPTKANGHEG